MSDIFLPMLNIVGQQSDFPPLSMFINLKKCKFCLNSSDEMWVYPYIEEFNGETYNLSVFCCHSCLDVGKQQVAQEMLDSWITIHPIGNVSVRRTSGVIENTWSVIKICHKSSTILCIQSINDCTISKIVKINEFLELNPDKITVLAREIEEIAKSIEAHKYE
jgi:hypothetical protein